MSKQLDGLDWVFVARKHKKLHGWESEGENDLLLSKDDEGWKTYRIRTSG